MTAFIGEARTSMLEIDVQALALFAEYQRSKNLAETTIRNRASILTSVAAFTGSLAECDVFSLRRFMARDVKAGTKYTYRKAIGAFYDFLKSEGLRDDDPSVRLPEVRAPKGKPRPFTAEQIDAMLNSGAYRPTRDMIILGCRQGFRVSQIAAVHGRDIDFLTNRIRTVAKGNKEAWLPMHPDVVEIAKRMPRDRHWFPARRGAPGHIKGSSVSDLIRRAKLRAGIVDEQLTAHSLRHSFGTELVTAGVDIRVVQELMLHEDLSTTQIYTGVSEQLKQSGIVALSSQPTPIHSGRSRLAA